MVTRMPRPLIELLFDFGSPNAYLVWQVLPEMARRHDAELRLVPCLLGGLFKLTGNQAPMVAFGSIKGGRTRQTRETLPFDTRFGVKWQRYGGGRPL